MDTITVRRLPEYDPAWADGCTLAPFLPERVRRGFQAWVVRVVACDSAIAAMIHAACVRHDRAYYYGGMKQHRLYADRALRDNLRAAGAPFLFRYVTYRAVRTWGGPSWRQKRVSWAYGDSFFRYGEKAGWTF